jgi:hypothetical protein
MLSRRAIEDVEAIVRHIAVNDGTYPKPQSRTRCDRTGRTVRPTVHVPIPNVPALSGPASGARAPALSPALSPALRRPSASATRSQGCADRRGAR